jgi:hypothetical protein
LAYSKDGINWTGATSVSGSNITGLAYSLSGQYGQFVATNISGTNKIMSSIDGINWITNYTGSSPFSTGGAKCVTYTFNNYWLVGGYNNTPSALLYYSSDLNTWNSITITGIITTSVNCIASNGNTIVAGGQSTIKTLAWSNNTTTWTAPTSITGVTTNCASVCWNGVRWIAGQGTNSSPAISYSYADAKQWYVTPTGINGSISGGIYGVASNPGVGSVIFPSALSLNSNGIGQTNNLEIVASDGYYQTGYTNLTVSVGNTN